MKNAEFFTLRSHSAFYFTACAYAVFRKVSFPKNFVARTSSVQKFI